VAEKYPLPPCGSIRYRSKASRGQCRVDHIGLRRGRPVPNGESTPRFMLNRQQESHTADISLPSGQRPFAFALQTALQPSLPWPNRNQIFPTSPPAKPDEDDLLATAREPNQKTGRSGVYDVTVTGEGRGAPSPIALVPWPVTHHQRPNHFEEEMTPMEQKPHAPRSHLLEPRSKLCFYARDEIRRPTSWSRLKKSTAPRLCERPFYLPP